MNSHGASHSPIHQVNRYQVKLFEWNLDKFITDIDMWRTSFLGRMIHYRVSWSCWYFHHSCQAHTNLSTLVYTWLTLHLVNLFILG